MTQQQTDFVKYVPKRKIRAVGTYYSVYEATQVGLDRPVELRVLNCKVQPESPQFMRFAHEFKTLATLDHPNVIRVLDLGVVSNHVFYVTDLRRAKSLRELLDSHLEFTIDQVVNMARCLGSALDHLHRRDIIHRNLTTATVYIDQDSETPYIAEFSMVKNFKLQSLTHRGIPQMTEHMRTPEFILGKEYDARTDIFQLGSILFQLLTGEEPQMPSISSPESTAQELHPRFHNPDIPEDLDRVVVKCLQVEPDDRFASALDFLVELERAEDKISVKSMLSEIHESTTTLTLSRHLIKHQVTLNEKGSEARKERDKAEETKKRKEKGAKKANEASGKVPVQKSKRGSGQEDAGHDFVEKYKPYILLLSVPVIILSVLGMAVLSHTDDVTAGVTTRTPSRAHQGTRAPDRKVQNYDKAVVTEAEIVATSPTSKENFHNRWYLLDNWVKQLIAEKMPPPFTSGDLVSIRINFYRDENEASRKLDDLFKSACGHLAGTPASSS